MVQFWAYHDGTTPDWMVYRVDMRSDTITVSSTNMRQAMAEAAVGDDVDPIPALGAIFPIFITHYNNIILFLYRASE